MTGYASAQHTPGGNAEMSAPAACLALELRSVNSRFLDVVLRLPDELRPQEPALRELTAATVIQPFRVRLLSDSIK